MKLTFENGLCYFPGFDPVNYRDYGVNYCNFNFIACIFACFGLTKPVSYTDANGILKNCYVYKKSYNAYEKKAEDLRNHSLVDPRKFIEFRLNGKHADKAGD